jgi:hypothetical protein
LEPNVKEPQTKEEGQNSFDDHYRVLGERLGRPMDGDLIRNASDEEYFAILETVADYFIQKRLEDARQSNLNLDEYLIVLGIIGAHFEKKRLEEARPYDDKEFRNVMRAVDKYTARQRYKEELLYYEEFRNFLGLTAEDEIPGRLKNGYANPEGVEAFNQFTLYQFRRELEKTQKTISEIGSPELWEIEIEYKPPTHHLVDEKLTYIFRYNQIYYQIIEIDIPYIHIISDRIEGVIDIVRNWEVLEEINRFIAELRKQGLISNRETLNFYVGNYEQQVNLKTTWEINSFLEENKKLETTQGKKDFIEKFRKKE